MAVTYREWQKANPDGDGMKYQEYLTQRANAARITAAVENSGVWTQVLGHYDIEDEHLYCLLDGMLLDFVNEGDTLLTLAVKAFEHEKERHA